MNIGEKNWQKFNDNFIRNVKIYFLIFIDIIILVSFSTLKHSIPPTYLLNTLNYHIGFILKWISFLSGQHYSKF